MKKSLLHACNTIGCSLLPKLTLCRVWIWIIIFSLCISIFKTTKEAWPVAKKQHNWKWMYHYFKHTFISCMDWYLIAFATRIMVHSKNPKIKCLAKAKHTHLEREKDAHPYIRRAQVINGNTCCLCFNITRSYHRSSKRLSKVQSVVLLFTF